MSYIKSSVVVGLVSVACAATWSCGGAATAADADLGEMDKAEAEEGRVDVGERESAEKLESDLVDPNEPVVTERNVNQAAVTFVPAVGCDGMTGTWRTQIYSDMHRGYYDFTLHIAGDSKLQGTILARSWGGAREDVTPPEECGDQFHWTVQQEAAGEVHADGTIHFGATSWQVGEHFCGAPVTNYSLDQFDVALPVGASEVGSKLVGSAWDAVVWVAPGMPVELTRTACE